MPTLLTADLRVNADRLHADFDALSAIGRTASGGIDRPALSSAHLQARHWFKQQALSAGLEFKIDGAGNHSAILHGKHTDARTLLLGSHLDSVPDGGCYDGALGVLTALEVLRVVREAGLRLPLHLEAIDFTDEEGTLVGLLGSAALAGLLHPGDLQSPRGGRERLLAGLQRAGLSEDELILARRDPHTLAGYLELHIEQGPRLVKAGVQIGVVTEIVGIASYQLSFLGRADHAGTTPLPDRLDAAQGAASFIIHARRLVLEDFPGCVVNTGWMRLEPGAFNIVPSAAHLALECRAADAPTFEHLGKALLSLAEAESTRLGLELEVQFLGSHQPAPMHSRLQQAFRQSAEALGLSHMLLPSGAGHDAQMLSAVCPAGMIFIPSQGGASHSPREFSEWHDCLNGANLLLQSCLRVIEGGI
jgi:N-carbamoyl-L-amino-acid hydrolase